MTKIYRTARGKTVDMDKVKLANETSIAVSNKRVNARGDAIGSDGKIAMGRNQIMDKVYAINPAADEPYSPNSPSVYAERQAILNASKAKELHDLANNLTTPTNPEPEVDSQSVAPPNRGSLASAVAKTVSVNQAPTPSPAEQKKSQGPTRI
jgi:hypothetical protein